MFLDWVPLDLAPGLRALIDDACHLGDASRLAAAETALRAGREAELSDAHLLAIDRYSDAVGMLPPAPGSPVADRAIRAAALAGIGRITSDAGARGEAAELFAKLPREQLSPAELGDWASCTESPARAIELHQAATRSVLPAVFSLCALGQQAAADGDANRACQLLQLAARRAPASLSIQRKYAEALAAAGLSDDAATALCGTAALLAERSLPDEALELIGRAGELSPGALAPTLLQADILLRERDDPDAAAALSAAVREDPAATPGASIVATRILASAIVMQERHAEALKLVETLVRSEAVDEGDLVLYAELLARRGRDAEAIEAYERVLAADPANWPAVEGLVRHHRRYAREEQAGSVLLKAVSNNPANPLLRLALGELRAQIGQTGEPEAQVEIASWLGMDCAEAWSWIAARRSSEGDADGAAAAYDRALQRSPDRSAFRARRGELLVGLGRLDEGVREFRQALASEPGSVEYHALLGDALRRSGEVEEALVEIETSIEIVPTNWAIGTRAQIRLAQGQVGEAIDELRRVLADEPRLTWAATELYRAIAETSGSQAALNELQQLVQYVDDAIGLDIARSLGDVNVSDAVALLDSMIEAAEVPDPRLLVWRARLAAVAGRLEEALRDLAAAAERYPESSDVHYVTGLALSEQGEYERALESLRRAGELDATSPEIAYALAATATRVEGVDAALSALKAAIARIGADPDLSMLLAEILRASGRYDEALEVVAQLRRRPRTLMGIDALEGAILIEKGRAKRACRLLQAAVDRDPNDGAARTQLARVLIEMKQPEEALSALAHPSVDAMNDGFALGLRGIALSARERTDEARDDLTMALLLDPNMVWAELELIDVLIRLGDRHEARTRLDRMLNDPTLSRELEPGRLAWILGDMKTARDRFEAVLAEEPQNAVAHELHGWLLADDGEIYLAIEEFEESLRLDPKNNGARARLAELYLDHQRGVDAVSLLAASTDPDLAVKRIWALLAIGEAEVAESEVEELVEASDGKSDVRLQLAETLSSAGRAGMAIAVIEPVLSDPTPSTLRVAGSVLNAAGQFELAAGVLERARDMNPHAGGVDDELVWAYNNLGRDSVRKFLATAERLLCRNPDDPWFMRSKGDALLVLGEMEAAEACHRRAIELAQRIPSLRERYATIGWCQYRLGEFDAAVASLTRSISIPVPWPRWDHFDLALTMLAGQPSAAEQEYQVAIAEVRGIADVHVQNALLRVAFNDLVEAAEIIPNVALLPSTNTIRQRLKREVQEHAVALRTGVAARFFERAEEIASLSSALA